MKFIYKDMNKRLCLFSIQILTFFFVLIFYSPAAEIELRGEDYFEIAKAISAKPRGKELILKNILRDHTSTKFGKSYFLTDELDKIESIIDSVIEAPTYYDFSKASNKLMIIKDFTESESLSLIGHNFIGSHVTPNKKVINSNRVTLFLGISELIAKGKPWDPTKGVLLTGFPDNPNRSYK
jgi:hypothetical protein